MTRQRASGLYVGVMSGTSLDGIDVALVRFSEASKPHLVQARCEPYPDWLRAAARALGVRGDNELERAALVANDLARAYADAVRQTLLDANLTPSAIEAIGCHGQTVRHQPQAGYTVQLVNGALLAELSGISVVTDFRSRDIAAGGQGAPLVPAFHEAVFARADVRRAIVNIGGIANVTLLDPGHPVRGFDTGPGNCLLDDWALRHIGTPFDRDGAFAATGTVQADLLERLIADPYFAASPPKSTGRDYFNLEWAASRATLAGAPADAQATFAELTARSIMNAVGPASEVYVCGGGASNTDLMRRMRAVFGGGKLATTEALGVPPDTVEACAFAWLARASIGGVPASLASVTGAAGNRVLGAIYPR